MHVHGLYGAVDLLLLFGQALEVELGGGRQRLDDILHRIAIGAAEHVIEQDRHFGVREKLRSHVVLAQILRDAEVVGEIAIVHERFIHADEGMRPRRMPDASLGGVTLVRDPDMRLQTFEAVVPDDVLGVSHDLENHQIAGMGHDESLLVTQSCVVLLVQPEAVLVDELVFHHPRRCLGQIILLGERLELVLLGAHEVADHVGRTDLQPQIPVIAHRLHLLPVIDRQIL